MKLKELIEALQQMNGELEAEVHIDARSENLDPEFKFNVTNRVITIKIKETLKYVPVSSF
jgi:hypothetical protein